MRITVPVSLKICTDWQEFAVFERKIVFAIVSEQFFDTQQKQFCAEMLQIFC